jgi:hypothetical protein
MQAMGMPGLGMGALPRMGEGGFGQPGLGQLSGGIAGLPFPLAGLRSTW